MENHKLNCTPEDFVYYQWRAPRFFDIGDTIEFQAKKLKLYVCRSSVFVKKSQLVFECLLTPLQGLRKRPLSNRRLVGKALYGKVLEAGGKGEPIQDKVRILLSADADRPEEEMKTWFPYATLYSAEGNTGWYSMPENGDTVELYFPDAREENAYVINSKRQINVASKENPHLKVGRLKSKYFRTKDQKELDFAHDNISIVAEENKLFMKLDQQDGLTIQSPKNIMLKADKDLSLSAKVISVSAKTGIVLQCGKSSAKLNTSLGIGKGRTVKGVVHIKGLKIEKEQGTTVSGSGGTFTKPAKFNLPKITEDYSLVSRANEHTNSSSRDNHMPLIIVNHITSTMSFSSTDSWFRTSDNKKSSAHFVVSREGEIFQYVSIDKMAWANGIYVKQFKDVTSEVVIGKGKVNPNKYSVSIEHVGTDGALTEAQFKASVWLHKYIQSYVCQKYNIFIPLDRKHIIGHYEIDPKNKPNCPGPQFPWVKLIEALK